MSLQWKTDEAYAREAGVRVDWLKEFLKTHAEHGTHYGTHSTHGKKTWINGPAMDELIGTLVSQSAAADAGSSTAMPKASAASVSPITPIPQLE